LILRRTLEKTLLYALLVGGSVFILFPMYLTVVTALKSPAESAANFFAPPSSLYLDNIASVMLKANFPRYIFNSILITVLSIVAVVVYVPMISFAIARNFGKRYYRILFFYVIFGIFLPFQVIMVPLVKEMTGLHLMSQTGLILLYIAYAQIQGVFLYVGYMKSVPLELDESALLDGASIWGIFTKVIYPLVTPMTATIVVINSLWIWNDFLLPLLILNQSQRYWTLPLFQYNFRSTYFFDYNLAFASFLLSMLPMMAVYVFMQKYIISGLMQGAVKG
jgi:raffinose/stachyose/melibiose transport system permease protein